MQCECGFPLTGSTKFCPECGTKVGVQGTENKQTVPCPNTIQNRRRVSSICGTPVENSQKFCVECGWKVNPKVFLPGAFMCQGIEQNRERLPCGNIVTPDVKFCSECGNPPGFGASASTIPPVVEKEVVAGVEEDLTQGHERQQSSNDQPEPTDQDMDFEFVDLTQSNGGLRRTDSYEKATNLENSSDFCNGFPKFSEDSKSSSQKSVTQEAESSPQDKISKSEGGGGESEGMLDSMEIVEKPPGGWEMNPPAENFQEDHGKGVGGGKENVGDGKVEKPNEKGDKKMDQTEGNIEGKTGDRQKDQVMEMQQENEQEVKDSGSLSTENSVCEPSWKKSEENKETDEQNVIERFQLLEMRKRKSPEREFPDDSKRLHLSVEGARDDKNGNKADGSQPNEEESVEEGNDENGEDEEDDDDDEDDDGNDEEEHSESIGKSGTSKKKKHQGRKKKKKER
ncbi:myb-like protein X [Saccostrea echinata]|uniref:myb-like protein X n=1 Tax=Saccostrea echinata TaxID=191078 RepID=UPI002A7EDF19|nr:myb-like protein X [Saccostrea echinata]